MYINDNAAQKDSDAFRLPVLDRDFLLGDSMRGVRLQLEYAKVEERLRAWVVRSTIVVFGSARVCRAVARIKLSPPQHCRPVPCRGLAISPRGGMRKRSV